MQPQEYYSSAAASSDIQLGLEALTICPKKNQTEKHCDSCMIAASSVSSSASSLIGDYIGMESCFDLDSTGSISDSSVNGDLSGVCNEISRGNDKREQRCRRMKKREFPPPIPSLARTENLNSHMPWVLKRYYTSDGRLILREEKVKHHEYFRAHRSNGRLVLHLVPLDDDYDDDDDDDENDDLAHHYHNQHHPIEDSDHHHETADLQEEGKEERDEEEPHQINVFDGNINNADDYDHDIKSDDFLDEIEDNIVSAVIDEAMAKCSSMAENPPPSMGNVISAAASPGKCLNFSSVIASPPTCFLGMPVPAIRPVHT